MKIRLGVISEEHNINILQEIIKNIMITKLLHSLIQTEQIH